MPIATISTVLTSVKTATEIAKLIKNSTTSLEEAEIKLKFADLISALADVKIEIAEIQEILITKDNEIKKLKEKQKLKESIIFEERWYFTENENNENNERTGPFCQRCYDDNEKLVRLQKHHNAAFSGAPASDWYQCTVCQTIFDI
jgi:hypothetical protein